MARFTNTPTGCLCRVPLAESAVPTFATAAELEAWSAREGIDLAPDHRGRLSISLEAAYRLHEASTAKAEAHAREQAALVAAERTAVAEAQARRQEVWNQARDKAARKFKGEAEASEAGWSAVHDAEAKLDPRIRDQLGGVRAQSTLPATFRTDVAAEVG